MRPPVIAALIFSAAAVGLGAFLAPHPLEQLTMIIRDRQLETALERVNKAMDSGEASPEMLMQAFVLNERYGDLQRAKSALREYLRRRPDDVMAWRRAAWAYRNSNRLDPLTNALERIVELSADPEALDHLLRLYRLHGRFEAELRVMRSVDASLLSVEHTARFASLLAARGDLDRAADLLRRVDEQAPPEQVEHRMFLFDVLLQQEAYEEAADRAERWLDHWHSANQRSPLVRYLIRAGADEQALRLAAHVAGAQEPWTLDYMVGTIRKEGRFDLLNRLVGIWIAGAENVAEARLDRHLQGIVDAAASMGMSNEIMRQLHATLVSHERPDFQASLLKAVLDGLGYAAIAPYRAVVTQEMLAARPILGARLLQAERNPMAARYFLLQADLPALTEEARRDWLELAETILPPKELVAELVRRAHAGGLSPDLVRPAIDLARRAGTQAQLRELWALLVDGTDKPAITVPGQKAEM